MPIYGVEFGPGPGAPGQIIGHGASGPQWVDGAVLSNATPHAPGNPVPGTSNEAARADHVHPDNGIYYVTGFPANTIGGDGATAIDVGSGKMYGPKAGGVWPGTYFNLGARLP